MSPLEVEQIQNAVRGMTEDQMNATLSMIPYKLLFQEMFIRYEHLLKKYTEDVDKTSGIALSVDTLSHK